MQLSVIIVNYNVKHFLEQCLFSVLKALKNTVDGEVIVVDNASEDESIAYLQPIFPSVSFISNKENLGFAKACNQGMRKASGEFILFLNPDCLVPEDCFEKCILFFENNPQAGALGIRMVDGKGNFLKESKRSFPSPATSFFKLAGFAGLFPHTKPFANYYLGHLDENKNHEVDVLAGAFFMLRKEVHEKTKGFDEDFFMYGEDIDLSYRVQECGFKNYYLADSSIIHFKGESTKSKNINYVKMFYKAMSIFVRKHYGSSRAGVYNLLIQFAIAVSAVFSAIRNLIRKNGLPLIDAGLILLSFFLIKNIWNQYIKEEIIYDKGLIWIAFPAYTIVYLVTAYYAGLYDRWYRRVSLIKSTAIAGLVLLSAYALLSEDLRFSRGIILFGSLFSFLLISIQRWILVQLNVLSAGKEKDALNTLIVGSKEEFERTITLMKNAGFDEKVLGRLTVDENDRDGIGFWKDLKMISKSLPVKEIIFCEGTLSFSEIMADLKKIPGYCKVKFHASGSFSIVGSDSKNQSGESVSVENRYKLADPFYRRIKRLIDMSVSLFFLLTFPILIFFIKKPISFLSNCFQVLFAKKSWVGYATTQKQLPVLRNAVIKGTTNHSSQKQVFNDQRLQIADQLYAREYHASKDLQLIYEFYKRLGE